MNANRITKVLQNSGIELDGLTITNNEVEVYVTKKNGEFSRRLTEIKVNKIAKVLGFGGFSCAYGGWVLREGYRVDGDWMDRTSACHY